jgi:hypothetical protein
MKKLGAVFVLLVFLIFIVEARHALALVDYSQVSDNTWVLLDDGATSSPPVGILAFSGMAIDSRQQKLLLFGGGHNDYWGNEVWAWDINTQIWQKMYEPDPLKNIALETCKASVDNEKFPGMWLPSGRPISRHTYSSVQFIEHQGVMIVGGYSTYSGSGEYLWHPDLGGCYYNGPGDTWIYDPETNQWTYMGSSIIDSSKFSPVYSAYDSNTGRLIVYAKHSIRLYDIDTDTWTERFPSPYPPARSHANLAYDSKRKLVYLHGGDYPSTNDLWAYNVLNNTWTKIEPQGALPPLGGGSMAYDSVNDVVITFSLNGLWVYDPKVNRWEQNPGNSSPSPAGSPTFGRLKYDPLNNVAFLVIQESWTTKVWAYRYRQGVADTTPPTLPQALKATVSSESEAVLTWQASVDEESGISKYLIYRNGVLVGQSPSTSYTDIGLEESTTYTYQVSALNGAGLESAKSAPVSVTTLADTTAPTITSVIALGNRP